MERDENEIDGMGLAKERRMQEEIDYEEMLRGEGQPSGSVSCSIAVIPSNPHPNREWHVVIEVEHQSFALAYTGEGKKDAEWMASMLRTALEKCGTRISKENVQIQPASEP